MPVTSPEAGHIPPCILCLYAAAMVLAGSLPTVGTAPAGTSSARSSPSPTRPWDARYAPVSSSNSPPLSSRATPGVTSAGAAQRGTCLTSPPSTLHHETTKMVHATLPSLGPLAPPRVGRRSPRLTTARSIATATDNATPTKMVCRRQNKHKKVHSRIAHDVVRMWRHQTTTFKTQQLNKKKMNQSASHTHTPSYGRTAHSLHKTRPTDDSRNASHRCWRPRRSTSPRPALTRPGEPTVGSHGLHKSCALASQQPVRQTPCATARPYRAGYQQSAAAPKW